MERKKAAFKGAWYPDSAKACRTEIETYLTEGDGIIKGAFAGGVVPHAGWIFSGSLACRVIASLKAEKNVNAVVIFGVHMPRGGDPFVLSHGAWETPFGDLEIHESLAAGMAEKGGIKKRGPALFPDENTIELQLPFIKYFFDGTPIVPAAVPPSPDAVKTGEAAFHAAEELGLDIIAIGSTDLTHYGAAFGFTPAGTGRKAYEWVRDENDVQAVNAILSMDEDKIIDEGLSRHNMCCAGAAAAASVTAKKLGARRGIEVAYATSYDKSPGDSFVGYSGVLFSIE